jgi:hypothetical protein
MSRNVKRACVLVLMFLVVSSAKAQHFEATHWAGKKHGAILAIPRGVAEELAASARDFATFRDPQWEILTIVQIGAATADAETSLYNLRRSPSIREIGISRYVIGTRPDAHKYVIAGIIEITVEAVAGHYLRNHRLRNYGPEEPRQKWYWRAVWTLPQSLSIYEHAQATVHNTRVNLGCDPASLHCY